MDRTRSRRPCGGLGVRVRLLAILWGKEPTAEDWARLSAARIASGYTEVIKPVRALQGSPGRILAVGAKPGWLCDYLRVDDTQDSRLVDVLSWCLNPELEDPRSPTPEEMIVEWSGGQFVYVGEEDLEQ